MLVIMNLQVNLQKWEAEAEKMSVRDGLSREHWERRNCLGTEEARLRMRE